MATMNLAKAGIELPRARQVSLLLTAIAIALYAFSIFRAELVIDGWGLIHSLPITFFISLAFLTIASAILWVSPQNHGGLLCLQLCFFIITLWLTPLLLGGSVVFGSAHFWAFDQWTLPLIQSGHLTPGTVWYHNWPGFDILVTTLVAILGLENVDLMLIVVSVPMQLLVLLLLYLFFRNMLGQGNYCWAAAWLFFLGNWTGQLHFSYQGLGFIMLLTILVLFTTSSARGRVIETAAHRFLTILAFAGLVISHLLSSIAGFFTIAALYVARRISSRNMVTMFAVFVAAWAIYGSWHYLWASLPDFLQIAFRLDVLWQRGIAEAVVQGSQAHIAITKLRILFTALLGAIGIGGFILSRRFKSRADVTALAIGAACLFLTLPFAVYGGEILERIFLFILPVLAYFGVKLLKTKVTAITLVILLLIALPLFFLSNYGNQSMEYMAPGDRAYRHFLQAKATESIITGGYVPIYLENGDYVRRVYFYDLEWHGDLLVSRQAGGPRVEAYLKLGLPHYINLGRVEQAFQEHWYGKPRFVSETFSRLNASANYNLIYINPDNSLYLRERVE